VRVISDGGSPANRFIFGSLGCDVLGIDGDTRVVEHFAAL
jgi:hypothetical protein